jgi:hypothetical protein
MNGKTMSNKKPSVYLWVNETIGLAKVLRHSRYNEPVLILPRINKGENDEQRQNFKQNKKVGRHRRIKKNS